jgi:copper homeostasis protein (lipoprotein)
VKLRAFLAAVFLTRALTASGAPPAQALTLPAAYEGVLPCADCAGLKYTLDLFEDGVFYLRFVYLGKGPGEGARFDDIGRFTLSADGSRLALKGAREATETFALKGGVLRKLDVQGKEIVSDLNHDLARAESFEPIEPRLPLRGVYTFRAGTGTFADCLTGRSLQLGRGGNTAALDEAYGRDRSRTGEPLFVELDGRLVLQPAGEGAPLQPAVVIERFGRARPGQTCKGGPPPVVIEDVAWKLIEVDGRPATPGKRGPQVTLASEGHRVRGTGGCNRLMGGYTLSGKELSFSKVAGTFMACPEGMDQDAKLISALEATATFTLEGDTLQLLDGRGNVLARFVRSGSED